MQDNKIEIIRLKEIVGKSRLPQEIRTYLDVLLSRLERAASFSSYLQEYESISKYVYWVTMIPWEHFSDDVLDIDITRAKLEEEHYGLYEIKERILEYIAVLQHLETSGRKSSSAPILCFVGLQGTGKTTIALSIAHALGRSFRKISLAGMPSSLELIGRNKSEPESEPGAIIKALINGNTMNPVILLDEVEKCGVDAASHASVMAALLDILDQQQNNNFRDHYIDHGVNLSNVFFVLTANNLGTISSALLDRLEIIKVRGYTDEEKMVIAEKYIVPKMYKNFAIDANQIKFDPSIWDRVIRPLGYEAGIRELERVILAASRKAIMEIVSNKTTKVIIDKNNCDNYFPI